ncbi:MAG TPA: alpha-L-fucosidase [Capsulimonadaceae bacterium]|jgi:alpha-L-fucosidase
MLEVSRQQRADDHKWFRDARFGMFIHWGVYSMMARGEWVMDREQISPECYAKFVDDFDPAGANPDEWAQLAKRAGAKYVVFTSRHHDGFALYDTKVSDFNSVRTTGRDFVREYVDAVRRAGLKVGIYYSIMSWQFPAIHVGPEADPAGWEAMVSQTHDQVRELMTNYGKIDLLWYDGCVVPGRTESTVLTHHWRSRELNAMVRSLQPHIVINDRSGPREDFDTPEQHVTAPKNRRLWEACMTFNKHWAYCEGDNDFKPTREVLTYLLYCARNRGNLLLNIGPRMDGSVPAECIERLEEIGDWLACNGEAIYGSERKSLTESEHPALALTARGKHVYAHVLDSAAKSVTIAGISGPIAGARLLGSYSSLVVNPTGQGTVQVTEIPNHDTAKLPAVIAVDLAPSGAINRFAGILPPQPSGGGDVESDECILGVDSAHGAPPFGVVIEAAELPETKSRLALTDSHEWCASWRDRRVATSGGSVLAFDLDIPVDGQYDLEIGVVTMKCEDVIVSLGNGIAADNPFRCPGKYPVTLRVSRLRLARGRHTFRLHSGDANRIGVYAVRLNPRWQAVGSEHWEVAGPYPTEYSVWQPASSIRKALLTEFAPELDGDVDWQMVKRRVGDHADRGVNYAIRGTEMGVYYSQMRMFAPERTEVAIALGIDWWGNLFVNGRLVASHRESTLVAADGAMFNGHDPQVVAVTLDAGLNTIMVKSHPGRAAHWFTFFINNPGGLVVGDPSQRESDDHNLAAPPAGSRRGLELAGSIPVGV